MRKDPLKKEIESKVDIDYSFEEIANRIDIKKEEKNLIVKKNKVPFWALSSSLCAALSVVIVGVIIFNNLNNNGGDITSTPSITLSESEYSNNEVNQSPEGGTSNQGDVFSEDTKPGENQGNSGQSTSFEILEIESETKDNESAYLPIWEEKTLIQKYPSFKYLENEFSVFSTYIKDPISNQYVGELIDDIVLEGYDIYEEQNHYINAQILKIKGIDTECAIAVKFENTDYYFSYLNNSYKFQTLGDLINKLNLREYMLIGTASYSYSDSSGLHNIRFVDFDDSIVWNRLLNNELLLNEKDTYATTTLSMSVNIEALGITNVSLGVNKDTGHMQTNILGTGKAFYLGKDVVQGFIDYIIANVKGYEIVYVDKNDNQNQTSEEILFSSEYIPN